MTSTVSESGPASTASSTAAGTATVPSTALTVLPGRWIEGWNAEDPVQWE